MALVAGGMLGGGMLGSVWLCSSLSIASPRLAFFSMPSRFWQLGSGALLCGCEHHLSRRQRPPVTWPAAAAADAFEAGAAHSASSIRPLGFVHSAAVRQSQRHATRCVATCKLITIELTVLGLLGVALLRTPRAHGFPWPWGLPAVGGAVGAIALGCPLIVPPSYYVAVTYTGKASALRRRGVPSPLLPAVLASRPLAYVGRISYCLYLVHWPALVLAQWAPSRLRAERHTRLLAVGISAMLAIGIHHLIERPLRSVQRVPRPWRVLGGALGAVLLLEVQRPLLSRCTERLSYRAVLSASPLGRFLPRGLLYLRRAPSGSL